MMTLAISLALPPAALAGSGKRQGCKVIERGQVAACAKMSKRVRKALEQQEFLEPLLVDRLEPILVPPLQGPLIPQPALPQFPLQPPH